MTHAYTLALPVVLMSIDIKQCARNYVKLVVVIVVFGRISTLVSLATFTEPNHTTDEKRQKKEKSKETDVCLQNAKNQVRYTQIHDAMHSYTHSSFFFLFLL